MTLDKKKQKYRNVKILLFLQNCQFQRYVYSTFLSLLSLRKMKLKSLYTYRDYGLFHFQLSARWYWRYSTRVHLDPRALKKAALSSFVVHLHCSRNETNKCAYIEAVSKNMHDCFSNRTHMLFYERPIFFYFYRTDISGSLQSQRKITNENFEQWKEN